MNEPSSGPNLLNDLAHEFAERLRRGERPALTEYVRRYPELATQIRELFPAMLLMEEFGSVVNPKPAGSGQSQEARMPRQIGEYRILREVARGGMGVIYEAVQESLDRHVALKVLPFQGMLDPNHLERFRREAKAAAQLHHTNIVPVFGVGEQDGVHYFAMQLIRGQSLDNVLLELKRLQNGEPPPSRGADRSISLSQGLLTGKFAGPAEESTRNADTSPRPNASDAASGAVATSQEAARSTDRTIPDENGSTSVTLGQPEFQYFRSVARVGVQVADALSYAHQQGVLHRDIKPANLLLDTHGTIWVTDFGLAKAEGTEHLTTPGDIVGTIRYMAPERFHGQGDRRSDIFSLGLTLYELATLRPAFNATERAQLIERILHAEPPSPRKVEGRLPRDLETIILKAIAKEPEQRYSSAANLAEDLRSFLADRPIQARRASHWERLWRWCRRNRLVASLSLVVALLLLLVGVGLPVGALLRSERDRALAAEDEARTLLLRAQKAEGQARDAERDNKIRAHLARASAHRHSRQAGQRFQCLDEIAKAMALIPSWELRQELRTEAIAALALPDLHITQECDAFPAGTIGVELSSDCELYARITDNGACSVRRVADDSEVCSLPELGEPAHASFGTGRVLAVRGIGSGRFRLWDVSGARPVLRLEKRCTNWGRWFHPNGRLIALVESNDGKIHGPGTLNVYDVATGACRHHLKVKETHHVMFHPREPFLAITAYTGRPVWLYDLRNGQEISVLPPWQWNGRGDWSPDGRILTIPAGEDGRIQQYGFDPTVPFLWPIRVLDAPHSAGFELVYRPQGDSFVNRGWNDIVRLIDSGSGQVLFSTHVLPRTADRCLHFDTNGGRLAAARVGSARDRVGLWSVAPGMEYRTLLMPTTAQKTSDPTIALHPGGRLVALTRVDGVFLFDLETGPVLGPMPGTRNAKVAFDQNGNLLTNGFDGFRRWPVRPNANNPEWLQVGPTELLEFNRGDRGIATSNDGRVLAQSMWSGYGMEHFAGVWILQPGVAAPRRLEAGAGVNGCSVSPDGRWVAFSLGRIKVYDTACCKCVWESPPNQGDYCRFSPDGRWLATDVDDGMLLAVGTWKPGPRLGPGKPWDMTRELAILGQANGVYRLVELATGRELARLSDPGQNAGQAAFTPDGAKLVIAAMNGLCVWDLRAVRAGLAKLNLDWESAPIPPAPADKAVRMRVQVDTGDLGLTADQDRSHWQSQAAVSTLRLAYDPSDIQASLRRGQARIHLGQHAEAVDDFERALRSTRMVTLDSLPGVLSSEIAIAFNDRAWNWAVKTTGGADVKSPIADNESAKALFLAQKAVELAPDNWQFRNTLGVVCYRVGDYRKARENLKRSLQDSKGEAAPQDLFFLAMCHQRLRESAEARDCYDRAVLWLKERRKNLPAGWVSELDRFCDEAQGVLGLSRAKS
jgi:serine/threonine protein kinase/WD40 repeat protein